MASRHNLPGFPFSTRHLHCIHVFDIFISEIILFFASRCIYLPDSKMEPNDRKQRIPSTDQEFSSQKLLAFLKSVPVNICREIKSSWIGELCFSSYYVAQRMFFFTQWMLWLSYGWLCCPPLPSLCSYDQFTPARPGIN